MNFLYPIQKNPLHVSAVFDLTIVTSILFGSLQKVSINRALKLIEAVGLIPEVKLHRAA
jgi:hypothetical protein